MEGLLRHRAIPTYYVPQGIEVPGHLPSTWGRQQVLQAPDGYDAGGVAIGPGYDPNLQWIVAPDGWLVCLPDDLMPWHLQRVDALDGPQYGPWFLPHILHAPAMTLAVGGQFRLDENGELSLQPPASLVDLVDELRRVDLNADIEELAPSHVDLAVDLVSANYHVSSVELSNLGWLDVNLCVAAIRAAFGIPDGFSIDSLDLQDLE